MVSYLIKSGICLALLLLFYHIVLEREKMHQFNRFFLLGSVLFSFLAPLYSIYTIIPIETIQVPTTYEEAIIINENTPIETSFNYWNIAVIISGIISFILTIRFVFNLFKIFKKVTKNTTIKLDKAILVLVDDTISLHTFWNYIFINKDEYHSQKIEAELFTHELTHVTQRHTFDVLLIEVLKIVFWFNPLFYFLKKSIQLNHEFIADEKVINSFKNISEYQYLLLNKATWNNDYYLASNLNYSLTKKRLVMMTTQTSKVNNWLKKIAVVPLLLTSIYVFAERVETYEEVNNKVFLDAEINKSNIETENQKNKSNNNTEIKSSTMSSELLKDIKEKLNKVDALKLSITESNFEKKSKENLFIASVERNNNEVNLKCYNCKRWANLSIPLNKEFIISDLGFTNSKNVDNGDYAFTIKATGNNIEFKSLKNTIWKKLNVSLTDDQKHFLNQRGLFNYEKHITKNKRDTIPTSKRIVNGKKRTFTYTTKDGKTITKKFADLTEEEKKLMPPPPAPVVLKEKKVSPKLFQELKNSKKYAIWIDGKVAKNEILNNYKNTDFYNYSGSFVHKNARSKRFPQEYQYNLNTKKHILKIKKQLPPPPPPAKINLNKLPPPPPKTGFYENNGQKLYYVQKGKKFTFYNKYGQTVTKEGKIINPEQTSSNKVIPGQNITKVYKDDKVVTRFKNTNLAPPPPKSNFPEVKKEENSNIPKPKTSKVKTKNNWVVGNEVYVIEDVNTETLSSDNHNHDLPQSSKTKKENKWVVGDVVSVVEDINTETGVIYKRKDIIKKPTSNERTEFIKLDENLKKNYFIEDKKTTKKEFYNLLKNNKEYHFGSSYTDKEKNALNMYISKNENKIIALMKKGH